MGPDIGLGGCYTGIDKVNEGASGWKLKILNVPSYKKGEGEGVG